MGQALLELDGSFGEGGGQILRTSLALSLITGRPFHLRNVRARRSRPGLQPQHLMSVRAAAAVGQAQTRGASRGSTDLVFEPGAVVPGKYDFPIGTAGATGLVLHTLYLPLTWKTSSPSEVVITGGTHNNHSPCFHFLDTTWRQYLERLGLRIRLTLKRPGFYPRGGGVVIAHIQPCTQLHGLRLTNHRKVTTASGFSAVANLPDDIARRQARRARYRLQEAGLKVDLQETRWDGGPGTVLAVILDTWPVPSLFCGLGARGKPAERVADDAVDQALAYVRSGPAGVDDHSADQLVLPLALAAEGSEFTVARVSCHLLTNIEVIRRFIERDIVCEGEEGQPGLVRVAACALEILSKRGQDS
jgi:RNA 3'-terminal phosphate cyclase (ATP)